MAELFGLFDTTQTQIPWARNYHWQNNQNDLLSSRLQIVGIKEISDIPNYRLPGHIHPAIRNMTTSMLNYQMRAVLHELYSNMEPRNESEYPVWFLGLMSPSRQSMQNIKEMPISTPEEIADKSNAYRSQIGFNFDTLPADSLGFIYTTQCFANVKVNLHNDRELFEDLTEKYASLFDPANTRIVRYKKNGATLLITAKDSREYLRRFLALTPSLMQRAVANNYDYKGNQRVHMMLEKLSDGDQEYFNNYYLELHKDLEGARKKSILKALETYPAARLRGRENSLTSAIQQIERNRTSYLDKIAAWNRELTPLRLQLSGLRHLTQENIPDEVRETIMNMKELLKMEYLERNNQLFFEWATPLDVIDIDYYNTCLRSRRDNMFKPAHRQEFFKAVFVEKTHICLASYAIYVNLDESKMYGSSDYQMTADYAIRHPHLNAYTCFGDARAVIDKALMEDDMVTAIYQMLHAGHQLTLEDDTVMSEFMSTIDNCKRHDRMRLYSKEEKMWVPMYSVIFKPNQQNENEHREVVE